MIIGIDIRRTRDAEVRLERAEQEATIERSARAAAEASLETCTKRVEARSATMILVATLCPDREPDCESDTGRSY